MLSMCFSQLIQVYIKYPLLGAQTKKMFLQDGFIIMLVFWLPSNTNFSVEKQHMYNRLW